MLESPIRTSFVDFDHDPWWTGTKWNHQNFVGDMPIVSSIYYPHSPTFLRHCRSERQQPLGDLHIGPLPANLLAPLVRVHLYLRSRQLLRWVCRASFKGTPQNIPWLRRNIYYPPVIKHDMAIEHPKMEGKKPGNIIYKWELSIATS